MPTQATGLGGPLRKSCTDKGSRVRPVRTDTEARRPLNFTDILNYMDAFKVQFQDKPEVYNGFFLAIMGDFKNQMCVVTVALVIMAFSLFSFPQHRYCWRHPTDIAAIPRGTWARQSIQHVPPSWASHRHISEYNHYHYPAGNDNRKYR
ncbi:hypothetical protein ARMGADRAFT_21803 [Armillaria gallica]|uniref:Uncharacterized protein n=1 Tax=Armillaria gallica TaxID=47427 RepID=A0A2H3E804_ARMGA|nr:hypothetical protein ARMGADRAFT_21803 [Armillaria gallica]